MGQEEREENMSKMTDRIVDAMKTYHTFYKKLPTRIHLEREDELDMLRMTNEFPGRVREEIMLHGFRGAIDREASEHGGSTPTLFGMAIMWDAEQFKVDRPEDDKQKPASL